MRFSLAGCSEAGEIVPHMPVWGNVITLGRLVITVPWIETCSCWPGRQPIGTYSWTIYLRRTVGGIKQ